MSETTTENVQENVQEVTPNSQNETNETPDVTSYIAESKKYRSRAQLAESELSELRSNLEKQEEERLAKNNKWEELATKRQSEIDSMKSDYERLKGAELSYKEDLLNILSEEERETFKDLSVPQLRILTDKIKQQSQEVSPTSNAPAKSVNPSGKDWTSMSAEERRANWGSILQSYVKR
jgi:hypothetical protein